MKLIPRLTSILLLLVIMPNGIPIRINVKQEKGGDNRLCMFIDNSRFNFCFLAISIRLERTICSFSNCSFRRPASSIVAFAFSIFLFFSSIDLSAINTFLFAPRILRFSFSIIFLISEIFSRNTSSLFCLSSIVSTIPQLLSLSSFLFS